MLPRFIEYKAFLHVIFTDISIYMHAAFGELCYVIWPVLCQFWRMAMFWLSDCVRKVNLGRFTFTCELNLISPPFLFLSDGKGGITWIPGKGWFWPCCLLATLHSRMEPVYLTKDKETAAPSSPVINWSPFICKGASCVPWLNMLSFVLAFEDRCLAFLPCSFVSAVAQAWKKLLILLLVVRKLDMGYSMTAMAKGKVRQGFGSFLP